MMFLVFLGGLLLGLAAMGILVKTMMPAMMFARHKSTLGFDETVAALDESARDKGWKIPEIRDLQQDYREAGLEEMTRVKILYFCNPQGGYRILADDRHKPMSVMMPMGVSVFEARDGQVYVAAMNLGTMSMMFGGTVRQVLQEGAENLKKSLAGIAG